MKILEPEFSDALASETTTLCLCWLFTRTDGQRFGASDHDRELVVDDVLCHPNSGLSGAEFRTSVDFAQGYAATTGGLSSEFITEQDLSAGLWDGARVEVFRVDWSTPDHHALIWSGRIGEVLSSGGAFRAELVSLKVDLERRIGRLYSRDCSAEIGDVRCGVDLALSQYRVEDVVDTVFSTRKLRLAALEHFESGLFSGGRLGLPSGASIRIQSHEGNILNLAQDATISKGDSVFATAGCDKRFTTCVETYSNAVHFRGFPHLPGMDAVLSGPSGGGLDDGGKR